MNRSTADNWASFVITVEKRKMRRRWGAAFASVALVAAALLFIPRSSDSVQDLCVEVSDATRSVILSDGSRVTVSPNSKLFYPKTFTGDVREVRLQGEAFFDVESSPERPFIVHLEGGSIKVTGTRFIASAYPEMEELRVSLEKGKIELSLEGQEPIIMYPSQELSVNRRSGVVEKRHLVFKDCRLEDITERISGIYGERFVFESESLKDTRLSFRLPQYEDVDKVMMLIALACEAKVSHTGDGTIIISE